MIVWSSESRPRASRKANTCGILTWISFIHDTEIENDRYSTAQPNLILNGLVAIRNDPQETNKVTLQVRESFGVSSISSVFASKSVPVLTWGAVSRHRSRSAVKREARKKWV